MKIKYSIFIALPFLLCTALYAQDDLLKELNEVDKEDGYVGSTFKGTRLLNGHTVDLRGAGTMEFIFSHRFGRVNAGLYEMFGLDEAYVRLGLDYSISDKLGVGFGRNSVDKTLDLYAKYKAIQQSERMPVTVTALGASTFKLSPKKENAPPGFQDKDRLAYIGQLLLARKFGTRFSAQLMPTIIHKNWVDLTMEQNDQVALGGGVKVGITKSVALNLEYYHHLNPVAASPYYNSIGIGVDIETGGHIFQLILSNSQGMIERTFITETTDDFFEGDIHFGFNVTRAFQLKRSM